MNLQGLQCIGVHYTHLLTIILTAFNDLHFHQLLHLFLLLIRDS